MEMDIITMLSRNLSKSL